LKEHNRKLEVENRALRADNGKLKSKIELEEPLVKVGNAIRARFTLKAAEEAMLKEMSITDDLRSSIIEAGNKAARWGDMKADAAVILGCPGISTELGFDIGLDNTRLSLIFSKLYDLFPSKPSDLTLSFTPKMIEMQNMFGTRNSCIASGIRRFPTVMAADAKFASTAYRLVTSWNAYKVFGIANADMYFRSNAMLQADF